MSLIRMPEKRLAFHNNPLSLEQLENRQLLSAGSLDESFGNRGIVRGPSLRPPLKSGSIDLVAGQKYDIRVDYFERFGGALASLSWSTPTTAKQIVPSSQLSVA